MKRYIILAAIAALSLACANDNNKSNTEVESVKMVENPFFTMTNSDQYIGSTERYDIVHDIFTPADYQLTISSLKPNSLAEPQYASFHGATAASETRNGFEQRELPFKVAIDKRSFIASNQMSAVSGEEFITSDYSWLYGNEVDVELAPYTGVQYAPGISIGSGDKINMYIPEEIVITSPLIETAEDMYPLCYFDNMTLKWNADPQNELGVLIVVEWLGTMVIGFDHPDIYLRRIDYAEVDNGEVVLDNEIFEDIPDAALCHLTILRGAVENTIVNEQENFKILAETHASMPFILVRNIKEKVTL